RAARRLAGHALALTPDDRWARDTWIAARDLVETVDRGWTFRPRATTRRYLPRPDAVVSVLAQSLPHTSGGYATRTHGVLTGLAARGWDVAAVTRPGFPYDRWPAGDTTVVDPVDVVDGIPYRRLLTQTRKYPQFPLRDYVDPYAAQLELLVREHRPAVVHASSFHVNGLAAQSVAARLGVPFVYEMRGLEELMKVSRDPDFVTSERHAFTSDLETGIALHADRVLVITGALRDLMVGRGVPAERIVVLPNGVHADRFEPRPRDAALAAELGLGGKTVIGYAGGLVDYEGLDLLLEAVRTLVARRDDVHLLVVGDGPEEGRLHARAADLGLSRHVTFTGRVPHDEVARHLSLVDVAPFPRLPLPVCEAISPIKPFESMAMGKAVVVSSVAALTEIIDDGRTGLVFEKGSAADLARTLERLVDDPELRGRLGESARTWVRAERDWSSIVGIVDDVYADLVGSRQPASSR
ncbi:glycosyltransferase family 4 protein, partial [Nocardioides sp.]|uniref:glycosyltransferase family 4 protein n=1 Tax=Nocardioides sp. TaxID=35761 RepID=UPI0027185BB1